MGPAAWAKGAYPWAFALDDAAMIGIAGLWIGDSFAIVSTSPNESVALMDENMPAILFPDDEREWLDSGAEFYDAYNLLKPFPAELMRAWPVAEHSGDGPDLLQRVA
jgi:putative SOS response-associated peptidase YedK